MGLEYGRRLERSNAKNSNKTGKTETARIETGGAGVGAPHRLRSTNLTVF